MVIGEETYGRPKLKALFPVKIQLIEGAISWCLNFEQDGEYLRLKVDFEREGAYLRPSTTNEEVTVL